MSLLFMDSFDHYATADIVEKWTQIVVPNGNVTAPVIGAYGRNSTSGVRFARGATSNTYPSDALAITLVPSDATCIIGAAVRYPNGFANLNTGTDFRDDYSWGSSNYLFQVWYVNDRQFALVTNTDGTLSAYRIAGTTGTLLGTTSTALQANVWAYVELRVVIDNAVGTVDVRINGVDALGLTGQDTQGTTNAAWSSVRAGLLMGSTQVHSLDVDDLVIMDGSGSVNNTFLGDVTITALYPSGAGTTSGWTPSAGSNYQNVDEALVNDDTDYNATATLNAKDTYAMQDCAAGADIRAVQILAAVRKGAEGPGKIKLVTRSSSTDYDGTEQGIGGTTFSYLREIRETDPATAAAWSESGWNAVEIGLKKTG